MICCAGIIANTSLATDAGLDIGLGIKVNDFLQTNDPYIYAIGECAEHQGKIYGFIGPGLEQANIAVSNILRGNVKKYAGSECSLKVKIKHLPVLSLATNNISKQGAEQLIFENYQKVTFRELFLYKGRLIGAAGIGDWPEIVKVKEAIDKKMRIWPWHRFYFSRTGAMWPQSSFNNPVEWSDSAMVCTCGVVRKSDVVNAMQEGCDSAKQIAERTGATLGCGTCKPLLAMLLGSKKESLTNNRRASLFFYMLLVAVFSACFTLPSIPVPSSIYEQNFLSLLLFDNGWQQVTGYVVFAFMALSFVLSLNKRWHCFQFASYHFWRVMHVALVALSTAVLLLHTNLSLGQYFNYQLTLFYFVTLVSGSVLGGMALLEGKFFGAVLRGYRLYLSRVHVIMVWILSGLLLGHVTSVYYF